MYEIGDGVFVFETFRETMIVDEGNGDSNGTKKDG